MCIPCNKTFRMVPWFFYLVTLTLKFDLLLTNFDHGFYLMMVAARRASLSSDNSYFCDWNTYIYTIELHWFGWRILTLKMYILLQTAIIFFLSNLYLKQGIGSVYVMVDFICKGYIELSGTQIERELQNEKILAHCRIRTTDLKLTKRKRYHWATRTYVCQGDKNSPGLSCAIFRNLPEAHGSCSKLIFRVFLSYNIFIVLLFDQLRSLLTLKSLQNVISYKLFCYIYHVLLVYF